MLIDRRMVQTVAIAYAFDICSGLDPCTVKFDHKSIRQHLTACLEKCQFSRFPVLGERRKGRGKAIHVELHCSCRLPVREGAEERAQCHIMVSPPLHGHS